MPFCAQFLKGADEAQYCERRETARGCLVEKNASRPSYFFIIGAERICFKLNGRCLLDAIQHKRSISAAATTGEMSYRHAWTMIREINEAAGVKLVEDAAGGSRGCGARLTDDGILTLGVYKAQVIRSARPLRQRLN